MAAVLGVCPTIAVFSADENFLDTCKIILGEGLLTARVCKSEKEVDSFLYKDTSEILEMTACVKSLTPKEEARLA